MAADRVCVGAFAGVHGVRGAVRIKSFTADPVDVTAYGPVEDEAGLTDEGVLFICAT